MFRETLEKYFKDDKIKRGSFKNFKRINTFYFSIYMNAERHFHHGPFTPKNFTSGKLEAMLYMINYIQDFKYFSDYYGKTKNWLELTNPKNQGGEAFVCIKAEDIEKAEKLDHAFKLASNTLEIYIEKIKANL